jgi:hypothetical protein
MGTKVDWLQRLHDYMFLWFHTKHLNRPTTTSNSLRIRYRNLCRLRSFHLARNPMSLTGCRLVQKACDIIAEIRALFVLTTATTVHRKSTAANEVLASSGRTTSKTNRRAILTAYEEDGVVRKEWYIVTQYCRFTTSAATEITVGISKHHV